MQEVNASLGNPKEILGFIDSLIKSHEDMSQKYYSELDTFHNEFGKHREEKKRLISEAVGLL